jgi:predicted ferric reductase
VLLIALIGVSALLPLLMIQYPEPTAFLVVAKALAKIGSLVGTVLFVWQLVLGFRVISSFFHSDLLWTVRLHERLGIGAILLILLHPVFISVYYAMKFGRNLWSFDLGRPFDAFVLLGVGLLGLLAFIFVTSVFLRKRLGYGRWFATHLATYAVVPLVMAHSLPIGMTLRKTPLGWYWLVLAAVAAVVVAGRLLNLMGWRTRAYDVTASRELAPAVREFTMRPRSGRLVPAIGQFVYLRRRGAGSQRPYSVAGYDADSGDIRVAAKAGRGFSVELQHLRPGDPMHLDGPYGVFGQEALASDRPLVMAAGGIGITAFTRMVEHLEATGGRDAYLFYGNQHVDQIAYRQELDALTRVEVVHVISGQDDYAGEKGFITVELMSRHVCSPLDRCEVLICGPPVMTAKLESQLRAAGVCDDQIHHELFGF